MFGKSFLNSVRRAATNLIRADRGNVAAMFAIALVPMLGIVGTAIDYSRAVAARSAMQAALDTVALMVSKDAQANPTMTAAQATAAAQKYFNALYNEGGTSNVAITATYTPNNGQGATVQVNASALVATDFMSYAGFTTLDIGTSSQTKWGNTRMRVAMVLDNTGSMADNSKMVKMKTAAKSMVDSLSALNNLPGDVYISLVPFAKNVNLGSSFNKQYIKWSSPAGTSNPDTWDENNGTCSVGSSSTKTSCLAQSACSIPGYTSKTSCQSAGVCSNTQYTSQTSCTGAGTCSKSQYTSKNNCTSNGGTWTSNTWTTGTWGTGYATWTPLDHSKWNGCVMDRDQDYDIKNTAPSPGDTNAVSTLFPAQEYMQGSTNYCKTTSTPYLQPIMPMTNNWTTLKQAIDNMNPTGGTNQAIGVAWGWQSLSTTNGPIAAPAKDANYVYQDYLVILSDGLNTQDRWPSYGNGNTQYTCNGQLCIDARQKKLCDAIKANNITVFTIQVNINNIDPKSAILQDCATDGNFQMITSSDQTADAFNNILSQIAKLRISQ
ncbi:MAG: pilus assembly protein [Rhizobiales bacterium]|nr:pilus assembly protein [Hyphomicrobiales bacterium]